MEELRAVSCAVGLIGAVIGFYYGGQAAVQGTHSAAQAATEVAKEAAKTKVDEQVQKVRESGGEVAGAHARVGYPEAEIVDLAEELGAGLIVMGSRGLGGLRRTLMGSVSDSVVRHAHRPVLVTRHMPKGSRVEG